VSPFSRREFLAVAAVGTLSGPEWRRYSDPATELEVIRLTDPAYVSGMAVPWLHQFTRRTNSLIYWSERAGTQQAFLISLKQGTSQQLTEVKALDGASLSLSPDERSFFFFDGQTLNVSQLTPIRPREIYRVPENSARTGFSVAGDGTVILAERSGAKSRLLTLTGLPPRPIVVKTLAEIDEEVSDVMARPLHMQVMYRAGGALWIVNRDGSGRRQLKTEPGQTGEALWIPSGRTFIYLHIPDDSKELITLREHAPDDGTDTLLAKTSQFISASPNGDASVFAGASRSLASAYVLILLRVARRELTLCEHHASDPRMVQPVFTPDSRSVLFVSDRHGKPAVYMVPVAKFVEETSEPQ
jgi:oligogalacturonide lyase